MSYYSYWAGGKKTQWDVLLDSSFLFDGEKIKTNKHTNCS